MSCRATRFSTSALLLSGNASQAARKSAELIEAAGVIGRAKLLVLVEVRDIGHLETQARLCPFSGASGGLDLPEMARKGQPPIVIELLVAEDPHRIKIDRIRDCADRSWRDRVARIKVRNLTDE